MAGPVVSPSLLCSGRALFGLVWWVLLVWFNGNYRNKAESLKGFPEPISIGWAAVLVFQSVRNSSRDVTWRRLWYAGAQLHHLPPYPQQRFILCQAFTCTSMIQVEKENRFWVKVMWLQPHQLVLIGFWRCQSCCCSARLRFALFVACFFRDFTSAVVSDAEHKKLKIPLTLIRGLKWLSGSRLKCFKTKSMNGRMKSWPLSQTCALPLPMWYIHTRATIILAEQEAL